MGDNLTSCPACSTPNPDDVIACLKCGHALDSCLPTGVAVGLALKTAAVLAVMAGQALLWGRIAAGEPMTSGLGNGVVPVALLIWWSRRDWNTLATHHRTRDLVSGRVPLALGLVAVACALGVPMVLAYSMASRDLARGQFMTAFAQFAQDASRLGVVKNAMAAERIKDHPTVAAHSAMYQTIRPSVQELRALVETLEPRLKVLRLECERLGLPIELVQLSDLLLRSFQLDREQLALFERELALNQEMGSALPGDRARFFNERIAPLWKQDEPLEARHLAIQEEILAIQTTIHQKTRRKD